MRPEFELMISFRTPNGYKHCGQYFLGHDQAFAESVFQQLRGREDVADNAILHLDLIETSALLPARVRTIGCKLSELCTNCEVVTRELFRHHAIRDDTG